MKSVYHYYNNYIIIIIIIIIIIRESERRRNKYLRRNWIISNHKYNDKCHFWYRINMLNKYKNDTTILISLIVCVVMMGTADIFKSKT